MKKVLLVSILLVSLNISAQVKTIQKIKSEIVSLPYDSTQNLLDKAKLELYIGQTFYLPKTENEKERGFYDFKKNIKGKVYKPIGGAYSRKTKYEAVAGKYFEVIGIERKTRAYIEDVYIHLKNKETNEELYFDFGKLGFPFIVQGYYEKTRTNMIGRVFYLDFGRTPKKCVDYYIEEGVTYSEVLKFDDNSTRILGELLWAEDEIGRRTNIKIDENEKIREQYGELRLGIDERTCEMICGSPLKKNISEGEWGKHEQWVYSDKYIYLENGKVTSIQYEK
jgi:hypothetical protein|nr:MAG TPA: hypothetical protein [Caudoviricetes sp.]